MAAGRISTWEEARNNIDFFYSIPDSKVRAAIEESSTKYLVIALVVGVVVGGLFLVKAGLSAQAMPTIAWKAVAGFLNAAVGVTVMAVAAYFVYNSIKTRRMIEGDTNNDEFNKLFDIDARNARALRLALSGFESCRGEGPSAPPAGPSSSNPPPTVPGAAVAADDRKQT